MTARLGRLLPTLLVGLAIALMVSSDVLAFGTGTDDGVASDAFIWGIAVVFGATGWLVASRHPRNPIGWLFLTASVSAGLGNLSAAYAQWYVASGDGPEILGEAAAKYGDLSWMPFILLPATFLLALFPDGRLLSSRWRPVVWCAGVGMGGAFLAEAVLEGPISDYPSVDNPFGVNKSIVDPLNGISLVLVGIGIIGCAASLVVRFRRSHGVERQQMKWLTLAGSVAGLTIVTCTALYDMLGETLANSLIMASVMGLPVAAGIAILRYRLYDIDVVINRTLVYGSLTALLAGTYLGLVLLLQLALESFTEGSGVAVAVSTLATAAVVRPGRARIQALVDRRFFRHKYDAARTLAAFGARLRQEVDLESLRLELRRAVVSTMQPAHFALWVPRTEDRA